MITPDLNKGEKIILQTQGILRFKTLWQQGHLFLTNRRLLFIHVTKRTYETSLDSIIKLSIIKRPCMFGVRLKHLYIAYDCGRGERRACIAMAEPEKWIDLIKESMTLMLAERCGYDGTDTESTSNT